METKGHMCMSVGVRDTGVQYADECLAAGVTNTWREDATQYGATQSKNLKKTKADNNTRH